MQFKSNKGYSSVGQLGILIMFLGIGLVAASIFQIFIGFEIAPKGTPIQQIGTAMIESMKDPSQVNMFRMLQIISTCCMFFLPALFYSWICNGKEFFWLGFNKYFNRSQVLIAFLIIFSANIMAGPLQELSQKIVANFPSIQTIAVKMEDAYTEQILILSHLNGIADFCLALLIMAFFPALFEELFFRGALQSILIKWWKKPMLAILVTSVVFSFIHMSIYLFLSRLVLGFVLGLLFYETKNIWVNTIAHFLNNALAVVQMYLLSKAGNKIDVNKLDPHFDWWVGLIAVLILVLLFKLIKKYTILHISKIEAEERELQLNYPSENPFE